MTHSKLNMLLNTMRLRPPTQPTYIHKFSILFENIIIQDIYHQLIFIQISTRPILKNENTLKIPQGSAVWVFFSNLFVFFLSFANITHLLQFHVIHATQSDVRIDREYNIYSIGCIVEWLHHSNLVDIFQFRSCWPVIFILLR